MYHVESASSPQWDQTSVPDVQERNPKDMKVMIPVVVDTAINSFLYTGDDQAYGENGTRYEEAS